MATNIVAQTITFSITDAKPYGLRIALSTQDNAKLLKQLKFGLKEQLIGINVNQKYQQKDQINS